MFWERYYIEHKERPRPKGMQRVRACMLYSRPPPNLGQTPLLDDPRSSNPFQLSSTTAPPSFLPSTSFHATRIPPLPNGTEQVDNLRIIQKLVPLLSTQSFPFSLSSSVPFYSPANHFESAGLLTRLINACPSPLPRRRRTFFREKGKEEYSKEGEKEIIIETPVDSLLLDRARTNIACLQSNFAWFKWRYYPNKSALYYKVRFLASLTLYEQAVYIYIYNSKEWWIEAGTVCPGNWRGSVSQYS